MDILDIPQILSSGAPFSIVARSPLDTFAECSILFKFKEGENFNGSTELAEDHRNISDISRIKI